MKTKNILIIGVITLLVALIVVLLLINPKTQTKPIVIIHQTWVGDAPIYLAEEKGFLKENNVSVEIQRVEDASQRRALLASGKADISFETIDMSLVDIGSGAPEAIVFMLDESLGADGIISTQDINTANDLKGKRIGCAIGNPPYFLLRLLMNKEGVKKNEVNFLDIQAEEAGAAFVSGDLDVACTWEPWLSKANERKGGHVFLSSADFPGTIVDVMVVRPEVLKERKEDVKAIMRAWLESLEYSKNNPEESNRIMGKAFGLNSTDFEEQTSKLKWNNLKENKEFFNLQIFGTASSINEIAFEDGMIPQKIDLQKAIDSSLVNEL